MIVLLSIIGGFLIGQLRLKWVIYRKTGKFIEDIIKENGLS